MNEIQLKIEELKKKIVPEYSKSIDVDEGWYQLVVDCDRELTGVDPNYEIYQIKEKFGTLRYYTKPSNMDDKHTLMRIGEIISKYEELSAVTCEATGEWGVLMHSSTGSRKTLNPMFAAKTPHLSEYSLAHPWWLRK
jgi:hypothetical protein